MTRTFWPPRPCATIRPLPPPDSVPPGGRGKGGGSGHLNGVADAKLFKKFCGALDEALTKHKIFASSSMLPSNEMLDALLVVSSGHAGRVARLLTAPDMSTIDLAELRNIMPRTCVGRAFTLGRGRPVSADGVEGALLAEDGRRSAGGRICVGRQDGSANPDAGRACEHQLRELGSERFYGRWSQSEALNVLPLR